MFCNNCGMEINNQAAVCPHCGVVVNKEALAPAPASTNSESNSMATIGFVFSFFIAIVGLICSIIGLKRAKELGGAGKGLAIAGIIISCLEIAVIAIVIIVSVAAIGAAASQLPGMLTFVSQLSALV